MYGLPGDFDPTVFVGRRLEAVTYGENYIRLDFGVGLGIVALSDVAHQATKGSGFSVDRVPSSDPSSLHTYVGRDVVAALVDPPRRLELALDGGGRIRLTDDSDQYESFVISIGSDEIVV